MVKFIDILLLSLSIILTVTLSEQGKETIEILSVIDRDTLKSYILRKEGLL